MSKTTLPQTLNLSPQSQPQADSPEMGTNWTRDSYCYSSFDVRKTFLEVEVCLSSDHVILLVLGKINNPIPLFCCGSVAQLCPILCSMPGFPVLHHLPRA